MLNAAFETAFIRLNPSDYRTQVAALQLPSAPLDARMIRRAEDVFERLSPKSFLVELRDLSADDWYLLPPNKDFVAEVDTRRYDTLTFSRASAQAEDVSLFQRENKKTIALYASAAKLAARGRFYSDDAFRDYDVQDFNVDVSVQPERDSPGPHAWPSASATSMSSVTLRLAALRVRASSASKGRALHPRVRGAGHRLVSLPRVSRRTDLTHRDLRRAIVVQDHDATPCHRPATLGRTRGRLPGRTALSAEQPHVLVSTEPGVDFATRRSA
jgi:hypothetical protein